MIGRRADAPPISKSSSGKRDFLGTLHLAVPGLAHLSASQSYGPPPPGQGYQPARPQPAPYQPPPISPPPQQPPQNFFNNQQQQQTFQPQPPQTFQPQTPQTFQPQQPQTFQPQQPQTFQPQQPQTFQPQSQPQESHDHDHDHVGLQWLRDSVPGEPVTLSQFNVTFSCSMFRPTVAEFRVGIHAIGR
ncbi:unnamed protein product, partial [Cyprideis torosa]